MNNFEIEINNVDCSGCIGLIKITFEDLVGKISKFNVNEINLESKYIKVQLTSSLEQTSLSSILQDVFSTELSKYTFKFI